MEPQQKQRRKLTKEDLIDLLLQSKEELDQLIEALEKEADRLEKLDFPKTLEMLENALDNLYDDRDEIRERMKEEKEPESKKVLAAIKEENEKKE